MAFVSLWASTMVLFAMEVHGQNPPGPYPGGGGWCRSDDGHGFNKSTFLMNRRPIASQDARCNDGSQAQFYFRPCCSGPDQGDWCNHSKAVWLISFGDGHQDGWCWDKASCADRQQTQPKLTSSKHLPDVFERNNDTSASELGAFSKSGEGNPNFYPSYAVYVPYCSSDLFLGECHDDNSIFCGKSIATAAIRSILPDMKRYGADDIIISGGAGIMTYLDEMKKLLPKAAHVSAVCDGCVLIDSVSSAGSDSAQQMQSCTGSNAFSCLPSQTLPSGVALWGASFQGGKDWQSLLSTKDGGATAHAAATLPLLAQQPLYDDHIFTAHGVSGADAAPPALQKAVRKGIADGLSHALVQVASSCSGPQSSFASRSFFTVRYGGGLPPLSYATGLYELNYNESGSLTQSCDTPNCDDSCVGSLTFI